MDTAESTAGRQKKKAPPLTEKTLKRLVVPSPGRARYELTDRGSGLVLRIWPSGNASWFCYDYETSPNPAGGPPLRVRRKRPLGNWPEVSIEAAREKAKIYEKVRAQGVAVGTPHATSPFRTIVEKFIQVRLAARQLERRAKEKGRQGPAQQMIRRLILPTLGDRPTALIQPGEVHALIEGIARTGRTAKWHASEEAARIKPGGGDDAESAPVMAHAVLVLLRQIFKYSKGFGVQTNPCDPIVAKDVGAWKGRPRKRGLSLEEVPLYWQALASESVPMTKTTAVVGQLLLLLGVRKGELLLARWSDVALEGDAPLLVVRPENRKVKVQLEVPLSPLAVKLFKVLKEEGQGSEWVCTARHDKSKHLGLSALNQAFMRVFEPAEDGKIFCALPGGPTTPHDMRRSIKLLAERCAAKADWAEREFWVLGHAPTGVAAHYDIRPNPERYREIMDSVSALVLQLLDPAKKVRHISTARGA